MIRKTIILLSLALCVLGDGRHAVSEQHIKIRHKEHHGHQGELSHIGSKKPEHHEEYAWSYPSYEFSYSVNDPHTHDKKGQKESRKGDEVKGEYWLIEPDGRKRTVTYHADKHSGFHAIVHYSDKHHHIVEHHGYKHDDHKGDDHKEDDHKEDDHKDDDHKEDDHKEDDHKEDDHKDDDHKEDDHKDDDHNKDDHKDDDHKKDDNDDKKDHHEKKDKEESKEKEDEDKKKKENSGSGSSESGSSESGSSESGSPKSGSSSSSSEESSEERQGGEDGEESRGREGGVVRWSYGPKWDHKEDRHRGDDRRDRDEGRGGRGHDHDDDHKYDIGQITVYDKLGSYGRRDDKKRDERRDGKRDEKRKEDDRDREESLLWEERRKFDERRGYRSNLTPYFGHASRINPRFYRHDQQRKIAKRN